MRDRAILEALYSSGIRRMELVHLELYDLDTRGGTLTVRGGKGVAIGSCRSVSARADGSIGTSRTSGRGCRRARRRELLPDRLW